MLEFELVLPAYNEGKTLPRLIERAVQAAESAGYDPQRFALVVVENGSKDDSGEVLDRLKDTPLGPWFRKVTVRVNQGYGFGVLCGLKSTTAPFVGWSHADMQCDPKDAFSALAIAKERSGAVLVKGVRHGRNWKDLTVSRVFELFAWGLLGERVYEINAQPKVFGRELLATLENPPPTFAFDLYVLYQARKHDYRIETIPVLFPPRVHGVSNWAATFAGRYKTILNMIQYMWQLGRTEGRL